MAWRRSTRPSRPNWTAHAVELLSSGAGLVVPHRDPEALAEAIQCAATDVRLLEGMTREARRLAPELSWQAVARKYAQESHALATGRPRVPLESLGVNPGATR